EVKFKAALKADPNNQAAYYYQNLINEQRFDQSQEKRDVRSRERFLEVENQWYPTPKRDSLPQPNLYARNDLKFTGNRSRQIIYSKLEHIHLDTFGSAGLPLSEVIRNLSDEARKRDPEKRGLNFIYNANVDSAGGATGGAGAIDPATGLPVPAAAPAEQVDVGSITIKIDPPINDITLADALDAIVKVADHRIKYSVEDYAVVFSLKGQEATPLYTRIIKVDPNTFEQGLQSVIGLAFAAIQPTSGGGGGGG